MDLGKFEERIDRTSTSWSGDPVLDEGEILDRKELFKRAIKGCEHSIKVLKAPPYGLSELILDGKKII
jgi:hypothetical protein